MLYKSYSVNKIYKYLTKERMFAYTMHEVN